MSLPDFLIKGYKDWKDNIFQEKEKIFKELLQNGQKPKAMVISCCDSRVDPNKIFNANEGDIFIHRNIANLVPHFNLKKINFETLAAVEYAINSLKISNIIILGHSNCGGIKRAYEVFSAKKQNNNLFIDNWIKIIKPAYKNISKNENNKNQIKFLEQQSIKNSISNLLSFPNISNLVIKNKLKIFGIYFDLETGNLMNYNDTNNQFELVTY
ncbi:hypothetical protein N9U75_01345 [Pelagibacteraceae bacterium]|nr:hypothetical protein [Pelagibacteraceae bacterium]